MTSETTERLEDISELQCEVELTGNVDEHSCTGVLQARELSTTSKNTIIHSRTVEHEIDGPCELSTAFKNPITNPSTLQHEKDVSYELPTDSKNIITSPSTLEYENDASRSQFLSICDALMKNPQLIPLPGNWVPQVIVNVAPCIMWAMWKEGYSGIAKRIVLFPDMTVKVSS